jgi:hypothetical protein
MDISCNILSGYFTTVDNKVCTKQVMYENIFSYDKSYVLVIAKEYFMLTTENNNPSLTDLFCAHDERKDISKYLDIVCHVSLKVKFGRFDFSQLWELESSGGGTDWSDLEITTSADLSSDLNHTCEIWTHIHTCKYPILVNGGKIVNKLNHHHNEAIWGLKVVYAGNLITSELTPNRVELLYDLGIDVSKITTSCIDFINGGVGVWGVEFSDSKTFVNVPRS